MIRPTQEDDRPAIIDILRASGQFDDEALGFVEQTLVQHLTTPSPEIWLTAEEGTPIGVAYCAPEPVSSGV